MRLLPRGALILIAAVVLVAGCSAGDQCPSATDAPSRFTQPDLLALHAEGGPHPRIVDDQGRQVLLRGVNLNALGDYYQDDPDLAPTFAYDEADFAEMATLGFDVVRLIVSWSALEPEPGRIDDAYLTQIHGAVDAAAANGLYTVIDMHQDAWGKFIATPDGVACTVGSRAIGWDGAPEWASLTDGLSTCNNGAREAAPAVVAAWNNFYEDQDAIQGHFLDVWTRLAREFADDPAVAGYDLLNEPGFGPGLADTNEALESLYSRAVDAIRGGEQAADGGMTHLVFFEPAGIWSGLGRIDVPRAFGDDPDLVFAPHLYAESLTGTDITIAEGFAAAAEKAAAYGTTFWSGEAGTQELWVPDRDRGAPRVSGGDGEALVAATDGGYRVSLPVHGPYDVRITPSAQAVLVTE